MEEHQGLALGEAVWLAEEEEIQAEAGLMGLPQDREVTPVLELPAWLGRRMGSRKAHRPAMPE